MATPIGNLDDISKRSIFVLRNVDLIICENPKHSIKLLNNYREEEDIFKQNFQHQLKNNNNHLTSLKLD